ncbi:MAG: hypothetical protein DWP97_14100 [Calditrichaeota bacterium]|nr:MAG: hypothetical protein DWP97_14100 [Calditrichota bacterium]
MLEGRYQRGFSQERLEHTHDPKVRSDEHGHYIMTLSENSKVYFDDYYRFLELTYANAQNEKARVAQRLADLDPEYTESIAFFRAKAVIVDLLMRNIRRFYTDGANLGIIMTPWCFGTVMLEKIEVYRDRISKGEVNDANIPDYPFYVVNYMDEIYKSTLLELFNFPEKAFQMRWQYSELLKKYSKMLTSITSSLNSVMSSIKNFNTQ